MSSSLNLSLEEINPFPNPSLEKDGFPSIMKDVYDSYVPGPIDSPLDWLNLSATEEPNPF